MLAVTRVSTSRRLRLQDLCVVSSSFKRKHSHASHSSHYGCSANANAGGRDIVSRYVNRQYSRLFSNDASLDGGSAAATTALEESPVVIIGGGPTGLVLSILLSQYNVPSTLVEARTPEQIHMHPQAHYLNLRTMEILKHCIPKVYDDVLQSMPPVKDWEHFTFGYSVMGRQIARVAHPVRGINIGQDGNGILLPFISSSVNKNHENGTIMNDDDGSRCSVCNPGHLAQNKFASILLNEARRMAKHVDQRSMGINTNIHHGESVHSVVEEEGNGDDKDDSYLTVHTSARQIKAKYVVVAEGSLSRTRQQHGGRMAGNPEMQHLINVHFRTSESLSNYLKERRDTVGMLHFVFNEELVGAFVCHNLEEGEWVLQIPYFPPFQEAGDFTEQRVQSMVQAGLTNGNSSDIEVNNSHIDILSIKPWTMSSTVAQKYVIGEKKHIILAGDAAHAFPPAGGFGMNTGIQDAHNLAWRLAMSMNESGLGVDNEEKISSTQHTHRQGTDISSAIDGPSYLELYESERRPIASQNAALSVRNYNRTLEVAKACYLNADHPSLLKYVMESPPMNLSPLSLRQQTFGTAVTTAMMPLMNLATEGNLYGEHIVRNVRKILQSSGGLPLLFPRFEIGFSYDPSQSLDDDDDTAGFRPKIAVGFRLPHVEVEVMSPNALTDNDRDTNITTLTDVEAQVSERWDRPMRPHYSVIISCPSMSDTIRSQTRSWAQSQCSVHSELKEFEIYADRSKARDRMEALNVENDRPFVLFDTKGDFLKLSRKGMTAETHSFVALLVRPDGHIANIKSILSI